MMMTMSDGVMLLEFNEMMMGGGPRVVLVVVVSVVE